MPKNSQKVSFGTNLDAKIYDTVFNFALFNIKTSILTHLNSSIHTLDISNYNLI